MGAYILRRLLLIVPTLFGIMLLNFIIIQFAPGGPIERIMAEVQDPGDASATGRFTGGSDAGGGQAAGTGGEGRYRGAQGLDADFLAELEIQFGFARIVCAEGYAGEPDVKAEECDKQPIPIWERFFLMMGNYLTFDFGESFYRSVSVIDLVIEKMPVSISLGLWTTLIAYVVSIPLGIAKAVRDGSRFDGITSAIVIAAYAIPAFLFAVLLLVFFAGGNFVQWFPLRGLLSEGLDPSACAPLVFAGWWLWAVPTWGLNPGFDLVHCVTTVAPDYFWHIVLPVTAMAISGFATLTLLTKNSFLDEIRKQYVITARAKGLSERGVLYGHVFRNAMLIVIAGFPGAFIFAFFGSSIIVETVFSLDGLGLLSFESVVNRDYPVVMGTLYLFGLIALVVKLLTDLVYVWIDPRIDFERRQG